MPKVEKEQLLSQYIDNTSLTLVGEEGNGDKVMAFFNYFFQIIGLELNWEKNNSILAWGLAFSIKLVVEIQVEMGNKRGVPKIIGYDFQDKPKGFGHGYLLH